MALVRSGEENKRPWPKRSRRNLGLRYQSSANVSLVTGLAMAGIGPGQWFAEMPFGPAEAIESALRSALGDHATIVDQSHARIVLRFTGQRVREVLATGVPLDLHPRAFVPGDIAQTIVAHIGVQIWQLSAEPIYELAVPRSLTGSFWSWLEHAALRHGLEVRQPLTAALA